MELRNRGTLELITCIFELNSINKNCIAPQEVQVVLCSILLYICLICLFTSIKPDSSAQMHFERECSVVRAANMLALRANMSWWKVYNESVLTNVFDGES